MKIALWIAVAGACLGVLVGLYTGVQMRERNELSALVRACSDRAYQYKPDSAPFGQPNAIEIMQFEMDSSQCYERLKDEKPWMAHSETGQLRAKIDFMRQSIDRKTRDAWIYPLLFSVFASIPLLAILSWRFFLNRIRELGDAIRGR